MRNRITAIKPDFTERTDRAVSPVIGVILMVAITVILAAVLGTFVLGIGGDLQETPQASMTITEVDDDSDNVTIRHQGGQSLVANDTQVVVFVDGDEHTRDNLFAITNGASGDIWETGQSLTIDDEDITITGGELVEVLLVYDGSGETIASSTQRA